jgi:hypothetical protein
MSEEEPGPVEVAVVDGDGEGGVDKTKKIDTRYGMERWATSIARGTQAKENMKGACEIRLPWSPSIQRLPTQLANIICTFT